MLVIGIDPGVARTGYGLVFEKEDGTLIAEAYGVITTSSKEQISQRLLELHSKLTDILLLHRPQTGAVEKLFFERNVRTAMSVGQARGVVMLALAQAHVPTSEFTPMEVKQAVSGYGGADKKQVQQMVRSLLNLAEIPKPDDAADALAVAICHLLSFNMMKIAEQANQTHQ
jgi:crossover junction endodeoxyribonuclease RuvC